MMRMMATYSSFTDRSPAKVLMNTTKNTERLTATISFRLTDEECRTLAGRANSEERTISQLVRLLSRDAVVSTA